jgi:hypothetical protein
MTQIPEVEWFKKKLQDLKNQGIFDDGQKFLPWYCNTIITNAPLLVDGPYRTTAMLGGWGEIFDHYEGLAAKAPGGLNAYGVRHYHNLKRLGFTDEKIDRKILYWTRDEEGKDKYLIEGASYEPVTETGRELKEAQENPPERKEVSGSSGIFGGSYKTQSGEVAAVELDLSELTDKISEIDENVLFLIELHK